jgi:hypothetical protein
LFLPSVALAKEGDPLSKIRILSELLARQTGKEESQTQQHNDYFRAKEKFPILNKALYV